VFSLEEGESAVRLARTVIDAHIKGEKLEETPVPERFLKKGGAFVTLVTFPDGRLRGCIGYPIPLFAIKDTIIRSAKSASSEDYRFRPVRPAELDKITVEVSLLTIPEEIIVKKRKDLLGEIVIGRDGLIVEKPKQRNKGLLLPQVAVDWGWNPREFLEEACLKATLPANAWKDCEVRVYKFSATVFYELTPRGDVLQKELSDD